MPIKMHPTGEVVVGKRAQRQAVLHPRTTYYSVKRLIGRSYDDPAVQEEAKRLPYKVRGCSSSSHSSRNSHRRRRGLGPGGVANG